MIDRGEDARTEISLIKFYGANALGRVIDRAIQVHGALGFSKDTPLELYYREARAARIYDGVDEVHRVVDKLKEQGEPNYIEGLLEGGVSGEGDEGSADGAGTGAGGGESDPLYDQAVEIVIKNRRASISLVQRHLRIGYNRAARLLEQMEQSGLVSAMSSNGNREILVPARETE